jgi:RimJ/RimL family protein N-acetyltransferase
MFRDTCPSGTTRTTVPVTLDDGAVVRLRPLRRGEVDVLEEVFVGMSARSRRQRFLVPMPRLPGAARRALADVDGVRRVAWVALDGEQPVGLARWSLIGPARAEIAFEVVDSHQRRGIGTALVEAVAQVAAHRGVHELEASVEPDNHASVRLLSRLGIHLRPVADLLEGRGLLHLADPARVDARAVLALADLVAQPAM